VPQENRVFESRTVREHFVLTGVHAANEESCGANKILDEWFPVLKEKWNVRAQDLSGGQQQMLTLALAFSRLESQDLSAPCLIILDEPTTGLQPSLQQTTYKILRYYCDNRNVGILFTEQRPEAANIVNRHYVLEAGHLSMA
jgi:branched-chain amino acid transport system ATP-binding protein